MEIGIVSGNSIEKNRDGKNNVRLLQCTLTDPDDVQSIEWVNTSGDDSPPANGTAVFIFSITESYKIAIGADDQIAPTMLAGERKLYSVDGGVIKSFINILKTGIIEINGNSDFAVKYNALNTILQQLATDINTNLTAISGAISGLGGVYTPTPIVINATSSKVEKVKLP